MNLEPDFDLGYSASQLRSIGISHAKLSQWVAKGYLTTTRRGRDTFYTPEEALTANLMYLLTEAGMFSGAAAETARAMALRGPIPFTQVADPAGEIYRWYARPSDNMTITLETPNPAFPLARARSSD